MNTIFSTKGNQGDASQSGDKIFSTEKSPKVLGPYSKAVKGGNLLFCSGQIGLDPKTMQLVDGSTSEQTHQVCKNIEGVLQEYGCSMKQVVKTTIFLKNMSDFDEVNSIYATYFSHKPARSCVEVSNLPKGALIEIEVISSL